MLLPLLLKQLAWWNSWIIVDYITTSLHILFLPSGNIVKSKDSIWKYDKNACKSFKYSTITFPISTYNYIERYLIIITSVITNREVAKDPYKSILYI